MNQQMLRTLGFILVHAVLFVANGWAYEVVVHKEITSKAFDLAYPQADESFFGRLGITSDQRFSELTSRKRTAREWIIEGSGSEDDLLPLPPRPPYHFFDPVNSPSWPTRGTGLNGSTVLGVPYNFASAPDWALNVNASNQNPTYSIPGTRESFYNALTATDPSNRERHWAATFRGVGQILHLLQDMAQPQHVRNDAHLTVGEGALANYLFPNFSRFERYTRDRFQTFTYDNYPKVQLSGFRNYWKEESGKGLAQFTNRWFVSQGTNFDRTLGQPGFYELPSLFETQEVEETLAQPTDYAGNAIRDSDGVPYANVSVQYLSLVYTDSYTGQAAVNPRVATNSFLDFVHRSSAGTGVYSIDNAVYVSAATILLPRAVGYTAGLLDYFFRGRLELSLPADGVYGIVDHSQVVQSDPINGFVGFPKVKVKVKNITPDENMIGGRLVAVAKFHRNGCYVADLTGEFDEQHSDGNGGYFPPCANFRTPDEEIVVSDAVEGVTLNAGAGAVPQEFEFNFTSQQIPINARDLKLQVVYRGKLGEEDDAVAVETKDISEPTYFEILNATDYFTYQGHLYTQNNAPPEVPRDQNGNLPPWTNPISVDVRFYVAPKTKDDPSATMLTLAPAHHARLALLVDNSGFEAGVTYYKATGTFAPADELTSASRPRLSAFNQQMSPGCCISPLGVLRTNVRFWGMELLHLTMDNTAPLDFNEMQNPAQATPDQIANIPFYGIPF